MCAIYNSQSFVDCEEITKNLSAYLGKAFEHVFFKEEEIAIFYVEKEIELERHEVIDVADQDNQEFFENLLKFIDMVKDATRRDLLLTIATANLSINNRSEFLESALETLYMLVRGN